MTPGDFPQKLYGCWHPVAYGHTLTTDKPMSVKLLAEPVVLWRTADGAPQAMKDVCIHRGTALSLGWLENDCLADPIYALPEIPELEDSDWKVVNTGPFTWKSDASRQLENFTDFGHFPWVHPGLLGDPSRPLVPDHEVEIKDHVLHYQVVRPEAANSDDFPIFANEDVVQPERRSRYEVHLPYTIVLRLGWGGAKGMVYFFASQPISANRCRGFCIVGRNYDLDEPDTIIQGFEETIFGQDQVIIESQRPDQVPFDLADELHLKFDAVAINYRRAMQQQGLDYYHYLDIAEE